MLNETEFMPTKNVYITFPLEICKDCRMCDPDIITFGADGFDTHHILCKYVDACRRAFNEGRDYETSDL